LTALALKFEFPNWITVVIIILGGAPISSISVVSYQFSAEVIYPVSEVQGVSMMNVFNKFLTFLHMNLVEQITDDTPYHINYMYGFIIWIFLPLIGLIPAFLVEEDLRRLNMKEVEKSRYVEEAVILKQTPEEKKDFMKEHNIIAAQEVLEEYMLILNRRSWMPNYKSERMTTEEQDMSIRSRRKSEDLSLSSKHKSLIKINRGNDLNMSKKGSMISRQLGDSVVGPSAMGGAPFNEGSMMGRDNQFIPVKSKNSKNKSNNRGSDESF